MSGRQNREPGPRRLHQQAGEALVLADPDYDAGEGARPKNDAGFPAPAGLLRDLSDRHFRRLPGTRAEGQAVATILEERQDLRVQMLTGTEASEESLWSIRAPRVLHLATHGFFLDDSRLDSSAAISLGVGFESLRNGIPEADWTNGLVRSGVALAGANASIHSGSEDGIVTAAELLGLDLRGTELVMVSGCDTAVGQIRRGEGVFGLERAFLLAGARSLVLSLWPVSDEAAAKFATAFYRGWADGLPKAEALRQANLLLMEDSRHPSDWGAFILIGDPR